MSDVVLQCEALCRVYEDGDKSVTVLRSVDLTLLAGEKIAIVGGSGSGKSTLLNLLGGLDYPSSGKVLMRGRDLTRLDESALCRLRNTQLGFVYQFHHLLPEFSAEENVAMPLLIRHVRKPQALEQARAVLSRVGLAERLSHKPGELSGGERQRAAVARALITRPMLVLADEPTGNLDAGNGEHVLGLMLELNRELSTSLVIVTHDHSIARRMDRILVLENGRLKTAAS